MVAPGRLGDDVHEGVEVFGTRPARRYRHSGARLDVDTEDPTHLRDEVGQRDAEMAPK